jgi:hypothetical protein
VLTVSWLRAYHSPIVGPVGPAVAALAATGLIHPHDDQRLGVFDIQAVRLGHFATADGPEVEVEGHWDGPADACRGTWRGRAHLLLHASGFVVVRLTLSSVDNPGLEPADPRLLARLERLPWEALDFAWTVRGETVRGNVRNCLNLIFLHVLENLPDGRRADDRAACALEGPDGWDYLHGLCREGRLSHPYPVSFGTHIEIADPGLAADPAAQHALLDEAFLRSSGLGTAGDLERDTEQLSWYFLENQSVVIRAEPADGARGGLVDPLRTALLEYVTLRRAALRTVQRDTQRVLAGRHSVSRRRLQEWQQLVQTATDDYVLSDRTGQVLSLMRARTAELPRVRDPEDLEAQVRSNLESFSAAMEGSSSKVTAAVGALFAVLAAIAVFTTPLRLVLDWLDGGFDGTPYSVDHPIRSAVIEFTVTVLIAVLFLWLLRAINSRLRAPRLQR